MADQWEYMSVKVKWDIAKDQWRVITQSGESLRGSDFGAALNPEGEQGWEVVNFAPYSGWSRSQVEAVERVQSFSTVIYLTLFKRRKQ